MSRPAPRSEGITIAIEQCNKEILNNFHESVNVEFPEPIIIEAPDGYGVHYRDGHELTTAGVNKVEARCTYLKNGKISWLELAGKVIDVNYER